VLDRAEGQWRDTFRISVKLPLSGAVASMLPFAAPTGHGLGEAGWVLRPPPPAAAGQLQTGRTARCVPRHDEGGREAAKPRPRAAVKPKATR
jgi:hypothetical protein